MKEVLTAYYFASGTSRFKQARAAAVLTLRSSQSIASLPKLCSWSPMQCLGCSGKWLAPLFCIILFATRCPFVGSSLTAIRVGTFAKNFPQSLAFSRDLLSKSYKNTFNQTVEFHVDIFDEKAEAMEALYNNEVDMTMGGSLSFARALSRGMDIVEFYNSGFIASGIGCVARSTTKRNKTLREPRDFSEGTVNVGVPSSSVAEYFFSVMLQSAQITKTTNPHLSIVDVAPNDMKTKLESYQIDVACVSDPEYTSLLSNLRSKPTEYFSIWDVKLGSLWGAKQFYHMLTSRDFFQSSEGKLIVDHVIRVLSSCNGDYVARKSSPEWSEGGSLGKDVLTFTDSPGPVANGISVMDNDELLNCMKTGDMGNEKSPNCGVNRVKDALGHAISYLYEEKQTRANSVDVLERAVNYSYVNNIVRHGSISSYSKQNITMNSLLRLDKNSVTLYNAIISNNCSTACRSTELNTCSANYESSGTAHKRYVVGCHSAVRRKTAWSYRPVSKIERVVLNFTYVSLKRGYDKITVVESDVTPPRILGVLVGRRWARNRSSLHSPVELPSFVGGVNERVEIIFESKLGRSNLAPENNFQVSVFGRKISGVNAFTCVRAGSNYCSGHGVCQETSGGAECKCFSGWYGMHCKQPSCLGTVSSVVSEIANTIRSNAQGKYASNSHCIWEFTGGTNRDAIELEITFDVEAFYDRVDVLSGYGRSSVSQFSGIGMSQRLTKFVIFDTFAIVTLVSDGIISRSGIQISYKLLKDSRDCRTNTSTSDCGPHGLCKPSSGRCLCEPGWHGNQCSVPWCLNTNSVLADRDPSSPLVRFGSHAGAGSTNYSSGVACSWAFKRNDSIMGVRLYPFKFDIDESDNLSFIFEDADETVDHVLINDPDVERDTNCKGPGDIHSAPKCKQERIATLSNHTIVRHFIPPSTCHLVCYVDIMAMKTRNQGWNKMEVFFTADANQEAAGFNFGYDYLPMISKTFKAITPANVRAFLNPDPKLVHKNILHITWTFDEISKNMQSTRGFQIRMGLDMKDPNAYTFEENIFHMPRRLNGVYTHTIDMETADGLLAGRLYWVSVASLYFSRTDYGGQPLKLPEITSRASKRTMALPLGETCLPGEALQCCPSDTYYDNENVDILKRECLACPANAICNGKEVKQIKPRSGSWKVPWEEKNVTFKNVLCPVAKVCLPDGCADGYDGPLCGSCSRGHASRFGTCRKCAENEMFISVAVVLAAVFVVWLGGNILKSKVKKYEDLPGAQTIIKTYQESYVDAMRIVKILIEFIQVALSFKAVMTPHISSATPNTISVPHPVPQNFVALVAVFAVFDADILSIFGVDCSLEISAHDRMVLKGFLPLIMMSIVGLFYYRRIREINEQYNEDTEDDKLAITMNEIQNQFEIIDEDQSGELDQEELYLMLDNYNMNITRMKSDRLFKILDTDFSGTVSFDEFLIGVRQNRLPVDGWRLVKGLKVDSARAFAINIAMQLLLLMHTPVTRSLLSFYECQEILTSSDEIKYFMMENTEFLCFDRAWFSYLPVNLFILIPYSIGVPASMVYFLRKFRGKLTVPRVMSRYGYFYKYRKIKYAWWEIFELSRRFFLTSFLATIPILSGKIGISLFISMCTLGLVSYVQPEKRSIVSWVTFVSYALLGMLYACILANASISAGLADNVDSGLGTGTFMILIYCSSFGAAMVAVFVGIQNVQSHIKAQLVKDGNESYRFAVKTVYNSDSSSDESAEKVDPILRHIDMITIGKTEEMGNRVDQLAISKITRERGQKDEDRRKKVESYLHPDGLSQSSEKKMKRHRSGIGIRPASSEILSIKQSEILEEAKIEMNRSVIGLTPRYKNKSFGMTSKHPIRKFFILLIHNAVFEYTIIALILLNCYFLAVAKPHPLCCDGFDESPGTVRTGFQASPDPNSADGIVKCGSDNILMKMNLDLSPGVGPRDEPGMYPKIWEVQAGVKCCVDKRIPGVLPLVNEFTRVAATSTQQCNEVGMHHVSNLMEYVFLICFTFEMVVKIIGQGFYLGKPNKRKGINGAYLQDSWNWLDFLVVLTGFASLLPGISSFSVLKSFRVLRPLKTMTAVPGMKTIVSSLLNSLSGMASVMLLGLSLFSLFGILGVQLFSGVLEGQCFFLDQDAIDDPITGGWTLDDFQGALCGLEYKAETSYGVDCRFEGFVEHNKLMINQTTIYTEENPLVTNFPPGCSPSALSSEFGRTCGTRTYGNKTWSPKAGNMVCLPNGNPNFGWSSFDNMGVAVAWIFTSITLEGWVDSMYAIGNALTDKSILLYFGVFLYFTAMIILCNFVMVNLALAVIADEYSEQQRREDLEDDNILSTVRQKYLDLNYFIVDDVTAAIAEERRTNHIREELPKPWGGKVPRFFYRIASNKYFGGFITFVIILNTVIMGMEKYPEDEQIKQISSVSNLVFTFIFICEMGIKLTGLGLRGYILDRFNVFDGVVVVISIIELLMSLFGVEGGGLAILRSLRLVRVFKLARSWTDLQTLLKTIMGSLVNVSSAAAVMLLVVFIFALLGMQFFGGMWTPDAFGSTCSRDNATVSCSWDDVPRANFDDIGWSIITVFQVLTGENWNDLLWAGIASCHYTAGSGIWGIVFFVSLNLFGSYMIMNIFLAILLSGFDGNATDEDEDEIGFDPFVTATENIEKEEEAGNKEQNILPHYLKKEILQSSQPKTPFEQRMENHIASSSTTHLDECRLPQANTDFVLDGTSLFCLGHSNMLRTKVFALISHKSFDKVILFCILISSVLLAMDEPWVGVCACYDGTDDIPACFDTARENPRSFVRMFPSGPIPGNSLIYYQFLVWSDIFITIIFVCEMILKIIGLGFVLGKHSYLRNSWNVLDFLIVGVSVLSIAVGPVFTGYCSGKSAPSWLKALRALRAFRALRPLRVIKKYPGLKLVVNSIFRAAPQILNVCMVAMLFFLIFAIMGVQFFKGKIAFCNDGDVENQLQCVGTFTISGGDCAMLPLPSLQDECISNGDVGYEFPRVWRSKLVNFDSVGNALVTIFEISSGEMWPDIMYDTIDGVAPGQAMMENYDRVKPAIYFVAVIIICAMVMINVFCGVIIDKYNQMKDENQGSGLLTQEQKLWVETMKIAMSGKASYSIAPPTKKLLCFSVNVRNAIHRFIANKTFDGTIMFCIAINTLFMAMRHADQGPEWDATLTLADLIFNLIFTAEAVVKVIGLGVKQYFATNWNRFDFTLVTLSWLGRSFSAGGIASLFRIMRVLRMIRLLRNHRGLMDLLTTIIASVPAMFNVVLLLLLIMFILSAIAMNLFANIKHGELLNEDANFMTFMMSFNTMWRMCTGESFNGIMHDIRVAEPYCDPNRGGVVDPWASNCGVENIAQIYFTMMFVILNYVFVNLCMAIILDNFGDTQALVNCKVTAVHMEEFHEAWKLFDPDGDGWIKSDDLGSLLLEISYPMGLNNIPIDHIHATTIRKFKNRTLQQLNIPTVNGNIEYRQTKRALVEMVLGPADDLPNGVASVQELVRKTIKLDEVVRSKLIESGSSHRSTSHLYEVRHCNAAVIIQGLYRRYRGRKWLLKLLRRNRKVRNLSRANSPRNNKASLLLGRNERKNVRRSIASSPVDRQKTNVPLTKTGLSGRNARKNARRSIASNPVDRQKNNAPLTKTGRPPMGGKATPAQRLELSMRSPIINPVAHPVRRGSNKLLDRAGSIAPPPTPITHPEPASSPQSMSDKKVKKKRRKSSKSSSVISKSQTTTVRRSSTSMRSDNASQTMAGDKKSRDDLLAAMMGEY
jgi:Ca2+-binding EF-hand superfamily protein/ABC-type taurine transport system substrate-binding protein